MQLRARLLGVGVAALAGIPLTVLGPAVTSHAAAPARGFAIGLQATFMALRRVFRRFFAPYPSTPA